MQLLYIGIFGGLVCVSRFLVSGWTYQLVGRGLPYGTLLVNIIGSFLLGFLTTFGLRSTLIPPELRIGLSVGFMGGFTTFSTFSYETIKLLEYCPLPGICFVRRLVRPTAVKERLWDAWKASRC